MHCTKKMKLVRSNHHGLLSGEKTKDVAESMGDQYPSTDRCTVQSKKMGKDTLQF